MQQVQPLVLGNNAGSMANFVFSSANINIAKVVVAVAASAVILSYSSAFSSFIFHINKCNVGEKVNIEGKKHYNKSFDLIYFVFKDGNSKVLDLCIKTSGGWLITT